MKLANSFARLSYGPDPNQFGRLRLPPTPGPHPVAIVIHGGMWHAMYGLDYMDKLSQSLTATGIATLNIEYRRVGNAGGGWPGTFLDVSAAIAHLTALSSTYLLDLGHVIVIGHSSGGHLALCAAGHQNLPADHPFYAPLPFSLRAVVAISPVTDLRRALEIMPDSDIIAQLVGGTPEQMPARFAAASPIELLPLRVRQIIIHGTGDDLVPFQMSAEYHAAALAAGDSAVLVPLPRSGHFEPIDPQADVWPQVIGNIQSALLTQ